MPRRPVPVFVLATGFALLVFVLLRPVFGQQPGGTPPADDPSQFPTVKIHPVNGPADEGKLKLTAVTVETGTGTTTIRMNHVKQITFRTDPDGKPHDVVLLTDKTKVEGRVVNEQFVVVKGGGSEATWKKADVREITIVRDESLPLVSILLGLLTLTAMEIVLGVDNIIFIAIVAAKLPKEQQPRARRIGLLAALGTRLALLGSLFLLLGLTEPLFTLPTFGVITDIETREVSFRDLILLVGGLFLIGKSTFEIHDKIEHAKKERAGQGPATPLKPASFAWTIVTIAVIDIVFSLDSVITAIGMVEQLWVMVVAVIIAILVMLYFAGPIANFVDRHPTIKVLALAFLILIGVMLVAEGLGQHMDKGYIYVAMAFSLVVELVNMRLRGPKTPADEKVVEATSELPRPEGGAPAAEHQPEA